MKKLVLIFIFLFSVIQSYSQCAMCKAIAESDPQGKESLYEGLNSGILYLMGIPYILLSIAFIYIYLNRKRVL
tara:strand:+ start:395 stop:613 length:219 start_codon:yes stop_codon:yes gene_type:complete